MKDTPLKNIMTEEKMKEAGNASRQFQWTDQEILDQIEALEFTIAYLSGRKDSIIVVHYLKHELEVYEQFRNHRGI